MATFVLEIGSEELPSRFLAPEEGELASRFSGALDEAGLEYGALRVMSTPRRAVVIVEDLNPVQVEREEVVSGPPVRVAYDAEGKPTKALEGFVRTNACALEDVFRVETDKGEYVAIMGESGSGKSTLLNILAMLDQPTEGRVYLNGTDTSTIKNKDASSFRREKLGFVFQDFNLLDTLSVKDNILLPLVLSRRPVKEMMSKVESVSRELGIHQLLEKYPYEISGGQKQRVAVARAIITSPEILLADEPTGALDSKSSAALLDVFEDINTMGQTILMVTHSTAAAARAKRVLFIKDGILYNQIFRGEKTERQMFQEISDTLTIMASEVE